VSDLGAGSDLLRPRVALTVWCTARGTVPRVYSTVVYHAVQHPYLLALGPPSLEAAAAPLPVQHIHGTVAHHMVACVLVVHDGAVYCVSSAGVRNSGGGTQATAWE
jgi:hypothetical protein